MKIEGESEGASSAASSAATDEMLEAENESLRERVGDLERKVHEQNDEILCLRATLADVLRRVTNLETVKTVTPSSKESVRFRYNIDGGTSNNNRRPHSYTPNNYNNHRKSNHYTSTGSLYSEDPSSGSASPTPAPPSPTTRQISSSSSGSAPLSPPSPTVIPSPPRRPASAQSLSNLHISKKWSSTSDCRGFSTPRNYGGSSSNLIRPASSIPTVRTLSTPRDFKGSTSSLRHSATPTGSLNNLNHRRDTIGGTRRLGIRDVSYNADDGSIRMYLRGKPLLIHAPTTVQGSYNPHKMSPLPTARLKLEWVYGYRGRDGRNNLYLLPTGEMVYFIAAVAVLYNVEEQTQRHYLHHTDDIRCMALHPNKLTIATGQAAGYKKDARPHVRVWDSVSLNTMHVVGLGEFERGISCLAFSRLDGGCLLTVVDDAHDHNISVWDWQRGEGGYRITETKCSGETVLGVEYHPFERNQMVTCGKGHLAFWSLEGGLLSKRNALIENRDKPKYFTCLSFSDLGELLTGDSNGNIMVWGRGSNTAVRLIKHAHDGPIFALTVLKDGTTLSGGGKDGNIIAWDASLKKTGQKLKLSDSLGMIRTISQGRGRQILVGTTRNWILSGSLDLGLVPVMAGHVEELAALDSHPTQPQFLTGGHDKHIRLWDSMSHQEVWGKELPEGVRCACFSPDGGLIAVGTVTGRWFMLNAETREVIGNFTDGQEAIQTVAFSPDGRSVALGSRDNIIYMYQVLENNSRLNRVGRCSGHSSFVLHIDWSVDSKYLRSVSGDYDLLYWSASLCRQITAPSQMRDVSWATQSCTIGFPVIGIWPEGADGTDIDTVSRSHSSKYLVTGDDFGKVKLFSYPAAQVKSLSHSYNGHSSHVTGVSFLPDDTRVISIGGRDSSVMQWQLS